MSKPSEEERRAWAALDEAIRKSQAISDNLDQFCNINLSEEYRQALEDVEQQRALREREENPPSWWERLLGL